MLFEHPLQFDEGDSYISEWPEEPRAQALGLALIMTSLSPVPHPVKDQQADKDHGQPDPDPQQESIVGSNETHRPIIVFFHMRDAYALTKYCQGCKAANILYVMT